MRQVITIDGVAASGKSSLAKALAKKLGFAYLNSGGLYRAVGLIGVEKNIALTDEDALIHEINTGNLNLSGDGISKSDICFEDKIIDSKKLETQEIAHAASKVAVLPKVREALLPIQQNAYQSLGLVAEGRDMGTVVFPEANLKIFITVPASIRAQRRAAQLANTENLPQIEQELIERDKRDIERGISPTKAANSAIIFDNSESNFNKQVERLFDIVLKSNLIKLG